MIKAAIFDLDGTLGDTIALCTLALKKAIEPLYGKEVKDEEIIATFGPSEEGTILAFIPQYLEEGTRAYLKRYEELHGMCPSPFEGVLDVLRYLRSKGIILAMVTGKGRASADITLKKYGLEPFFQDVETGHPHGPRKPEGIRAILARRGLSPSEAVYVGDTPGDITASREVGVPVLSAAWAHSTDRKALEALKPDELFTSVADFADYWKKRLG